MKHFTSSLRSSVCRLINLAHQSRPVQVCSEIVLQGRFSRVSQQSGPTHILPCVCRWTRKVAVDPSPADPPKPMRPTAELATEGAPAQPSTSDSAGPAPWRPGGARREGAAPPSGMLYSCCNKQDATPFWCGLGIPLGKGALPHGRHENDQHCEKMSSKKGQSASQVDLMVCPVLLPCHLHLWGSICLDCSTCMDEALLPQSCGAFGLSVS